MKKLLLIVSSLLITFSVISGSLFASSDENSDKKNDEIEAKVAKEAKANEKLVILPPPPLDEDAENFPCMECHEDQEINKEWRILEDNHEDIELKGHAEDSRWCLDCHDASNRDKLRLTDGRLIDFTESYKLCAQCHGTISNDWEMGIHGKRTGFWNGEKKVQVCGSCHNAHSPQFKKIKPMPAPIKPGRR